MPLCPLAPGGGGSGVGICLVLLRSSGAHCHNWLITCLTPRAAPYSGLSEGGAELLIIHGALWDLIVDAVERDVCPS